MISRWARERERERVRESEGEIRHRAAEPQRESILAIRRLSAPIRCSSHARFSFSFEYGIERPRRGITRQRYLTKRAGERSYIDVNPRRGDKNAATFAVLRSIHERLLPIRRPTLSTSEYRGGGGKSWLSQSLSVQLAR